MYASGEWSTGVPEMPDVTYHNPEPDLSGWRREAHKFSTAYNHSIHGRRAVKSQIFVPNSTTGRRVLSVEGNIKGLVLFIHSRIPF